MLTLIQEPDFLGGRKTSEMKNTDALKRLLLHKSNKRQDFHGNKEERGVSSMYGTSIDKDLKPIAKEIRALKALNPSQIQSSKKDLRI